MHRLVRAPAFVLLLIAMAAAPVKVRTIPLSLLVKQSQLIVVADVVAVRNPLLGPRIATAVPSEFWKGSAGESIEFVASPSWSCDVATAIEGERVVLFLKQTESSVYAIAHSGRGRMPFVQVDSDAYASIYGELTFPADAVSSLVAPDSGRSFSGIAVHELERLVDAARVSEQAAALPLGDSFVTVNESRMHVRRVGESGPSVVLVSALGGGVDDWNGVSQALGSFARVLAYDRFGLGTSDPGPEPRSAGVMAEELHALLRSSGLPAPYLLCGHSLGGCIVELYAGRYPEEVCGLVLVDHTLESHVRLMQEQGRDLIGDIDTEGWPDGPRGELNALELTLAELRASPSLPALPCTLLISTKHGLDPVGENLWLATHLEWAQSHPPATCEIDREHGHYLQVENPGLVIEALRRVAADCGASSR